jgi:hypothetical protein
MNGAMTNCENTATTNTRTYRVRKAQAFDKFGKDELMTLSIRRTVQDIIRSYPLSERIIYLLRNLGIPATSAGYRYLKDAIEMVHGNPDEHAFITKTVYPMIARKHVSTSERVERNIRSAIKSIEADNMYRQIIFKDVKSKTNKEFIFGLAEFIR